MRLYFYGKRGYTMHKIRVAQLNVEIDYKYETMTKQSEAYKTDFDTADITVNVTDESIEKMHEEYPHLSLNDCEYMLTGFIFFTINYCIMTALCSIPQQSYSIMKLICFQLQAAQENRLILSFG